jgi:TPR repeat protein
MPAPFSISKNWARAEKLLAGMDKNKEALELLADMYLKGNENFPKSISKAREFYRISIKLGNKTAEKKLKNILTE